MSLNEKTPTLFLSLPYPCSYLPERQATTLFLDPQHPVDGGTFERYTHLGFRRSGNLVYRPHCQQCQACVSVRVSTREFRPSRGQRRIWQRNQDLVVREAPATFAHEQFALYLRYQDARHPDSSMNDSNPKLYSDFLISRFADTRFLEFRDTDQHLLAVAVTDVLSDGYSAVYTFYDPDLPRRGLGVHALLWQIDRARNEGRDWVYLGYWIAGCAKMDYKSRYQPLQAFRDGKWGPF